MKSMRILLFSIFLCIISFGFGIPELKASSNCTNSIPELFKQVSPSVVFISATSIDPFKVINRVKSAIGSGFIFSKDGLILTNSHVVFGQQLIIATLDDGKKVVAKLVGVDPILDLAVLRIPLPPEGLSTATFGDPHFLSNGVSMISPWHPHEGLNGL